MKVVKESNEVVQGKGFGVSWACGHGRHALDKHDRDTLHDIWGFVVPPDVRL